MSDTEASWRHVTAADESQRHLPKYYSLTRQGATPVYVDQRKASTLPRQYERSRISDGSKSMKTETGSTKYYSETGGKYGKGKPAKSSAGDMGLLETIRKVETETTPRDITQEGVIGPKSEEVCEEPVGGSLGPVFRRGRRSRPSAVASRRSSVLAVTRRGKLAAAKRGPPSARVPPVGAAASPSKTDGPFGAEWMGCLPRLDSRDSDEESYVTACNSTPLLSRTFPSTRKDRTTQHPDHRKSSQTGNGRRRRRRLKSPISGYSVGEHLTKDHPQPQETFQDTTPVYVPIPVIVVLICLYVLVGTVMFNQLYGVADWSAAVFISVAAMLTVGGWYPDPRAGDDGAVDGPWPPDARFVYAMWVVFGLAIVSACLQLAAQTLSHCLPRCRQCTTPDSLSYVI